MTTEEFDYLNFDYTKLSDFMICPRRGYFAHIRHWQPDIVAAPLAFGAAMHRGLEFIYRDPKRSPQDLVASGVEGFTQEWKEWGLDPMEFHPRSVAKGLELIEGYISHYLRELHETVVHGVEIAFEVPLDNETKTTYHGRIDTFVEIPQTPGIYVLEHKTTSSFSSTWMNGFSPNAQIDGYCHANHMMFGDDAKGVLVNGLLVQKTKSDFTRVPVLRQWEHLDAWRWEVLDKIQDIRFEWNRLVVARATDGFQDRSFMPAFPKQTTACSFYGGCRYQDLCKISSNPEQWVEAPPGFVYKPWDYKRS